MPRTPLRDTTREAVLAAIREWDELGAESFREQYGYGPARVYQLRHDGQTYDSKAIVGVAQRYVSGQPLRPQVFSGGEQTVGRLLLRPGFEVKRSRTPDWTRDELVLACALVAQNGWKGPNSAKLTRG
ncbi:hypothetical protein [Cryptosporangium arvum]|uniref:hypothetical protein n=1 Tax=Cryptosporangium arvum TaxID=80871 RepID=UPI000688F9CA|nr:hypothetical protein [Cryptosporangium arvum]